MFKDIFDFSYFDKKSANDTSSKKIASEISFKKHDKKYSKFMLFDIKNEQNMFEN